MGSAFEHKLLVLCAHLTDLVWVRTWTGVGFGDGLESLSAGVWIY